MVMQEEAGGFIESKPHLSSRKETVCVCACVHVCVCMRKNQQYKHVIYRYGDKLLRN